jgi:SAM-dependent methyltransferase
VTTSSIDPAAPAPSYAFDNDDPDAVDRHRHLAGILDEFTFARLSTVGDLAGRRCLEVGAGGGSVARWLAGRVGPTGRVLATDLKTLHLPTDQGYEVERNDLTLDPVPAGPWDLIHARLVLMHLPERREIFTRLVAALAPGGALALEEWATLFGSIVLASPSPADTALFDSYQDTLIHRILIPNGNDPTWGVAVHAEMLAAGLVDVDTAIESRAWRGGTPGALIVAANIGQLRAEFLDLGFSAADLDRLVALVRDPRFVVRTHFTYSTIGRRPTG